jgi:hypothetical protein
MVTLDRWARAPRSGGAGTWRLGRHGLLSRLGLLA